MDITTTTAHTASAAGNPGVHVVSTTALILFLEMAAHELIAPSFEPGEGSVGTKVDISHLAACKAGTVVVAEAVVTSVDGRRVGFDVEARDGRRVLMRGHHERVVVDLDRFLKKQGLI